MSIFPAKSLLATDGSEEAHLALQTAVDLTKSTNSELGVLTVGMPDIPEYAELLEETYRMFEVEGQKTLAEQVKKVEEAGGTVTEARLSMEQRPAQQIVGLAEEMGAGQIVVGSRSEER